MNEEWRSIPSMPGYSASSDGRVKGRSGKVLTQHRTWNGYLYVHAAKVTTVNRLVCEAFNGPPPALGRQAAHYNGNRADNRPENLRWATRQENYQDQIRHGTSKRGSGHHLAKLSEADVLTIRALARAGVRQRDIASRFSIRDSTVCRIVVGKRWGHV